MFSRSILALIVMVAMTLPGKAQDNPIVSRMKAFTEAFNAGDAEVIAGIYAEDGALLVPQGGIVVGREAMAKHYAAAFGSGVGNLQYRVLEIRKAGPATAVEIGETRIVVNGQTVANRSMHVWVFSDGEWFLSRDMYHVLGTVKP